LSRWLASLDPGGPDTGVVDDEQIAGYQEVRQIGNAMMGDAPIFGAENEQPGLLPWKHWLGGNERGIEGKIKR
jgi:hypothetical protein